MRRPFTADNRKDRDLVLRMLRYEDSVFTGELGQKIFSDPMMVRFRPNDAIARLTMDHFGFDATDQSLAEYREIFRTYYNGPTDYDEEIMDAVVYFRGNRINWYTEPKISVGSKIPDAAIFRLDGSETSVYDVLAEKPYSRAIVAGFSLS